MSWSGRVVVSCLLFLPATSLADEFADFRIPAHKFFSWTGRLSASPGSDEVSANFPSRSGAVEGSLRSSTSWLHDPDSRLSIFSVDVSANGQRAGAEREG